MTRPAALDPVDTIALAHHNLGVLRCQAQPWAVRQCEAWLDHHDPGWRQRPKAAG